MLRGGGKYSSSSVTLHLLDAVARREAGDHRLDELLGRRRAGGDADGAGEVGGQLVGVVDAVDARAPGARWPASRAPGCWTSWPSRSRRSASHRGAISISADWRLVVAKHRSLRPGVHTSGKRCLRGVGDVGPVAVRQRRLGQQRDRFVELRAGPSTSATDSTRCDRVGRDGHRADRLLVALVADVDDAVALAGPHLHLVVHLGDERAHRVDHVAAPRPAAAARPRAPSRGPTA